MAFNGMLVFKMDVVFPSTEMLVVAGCHVVPDSDYKVKIGEPRHDQPTEPSVRSVTT
jgi:hypothetical protein